MAFPSSPVNGQTAVLNGLTYSYNSTTKAWTRVQTNWAGITYVANVAPPTTNLTAGSQWYDTNSDTLFSYEYDGVTSHWVDISTPTVTTSGLGSTYISSSSAPTSASAGYQWYNTLTDILYEYVYDGTSNLGTLTKNGLTMSVNVSTGVYTLSGASWTSDTEQFTLRAVTTGGTFDRSYSITKTKAGAAGANARILTLGVDNNYFVVDKLGVATPTSINFTATPGGALTGTATWTVTTGTATLTGTGNTRALAYTDMTTDLVTIQASITDSTGVYSDKITIGKLKSGSDSAVGMLTNESITLAADASGTVGSYATATTDIKIYLGVTDDSANWTVSKVDGTGVTSTLSTRTVTVSAMSVDTGYEIGRAHV